MKPCAPLLFTALLGFSVLLLCGGCAYYRPGGLPPAAASGQRYNHYDRSGRLTGHTRQVGDKLVHYDRAGRITGETRLPAQP